jgi:spermidine synthase
MIRWVQIGAASVPGGDEGLRLMRRGSEFSIFVGSAELMGTRLSGSEAALAALACARLADRRRPHVLIGGLGMGFTLRAALAALGPDATITLAELVPEILAWARGPLAAIHGDSLDDPRVQLVEGDVGDLIAGVNGRYDAILLDVDNGPEGLMRAANDDLYDACGLREARGALRPQGVLAVWSAAPHAAFAQRLRDTGFAVEEHRVRANGRTSGPRHVVWVAMRAESNAEPGADSGAGPARPGPPAPARARGRRPSRRPRRSSDV